MLILRKVTPDRLFRVTLLPVRKIAVLISPLCLGLSKHIFNSSIGGKEMKKRRKEKREERKSQLISIRCRAKTKIDREIPETTSGNVQVASCKK